MATEKGRFSGPYFHENLDKLEKVYYFLLKNLEKYSALDLKSAEQLLPVRKAITASHVSVLDTLRLGEYIASHGGVQNFLEKDVWQLDVSIAVCLMAQW